MPIGEIEKAIGCRIAVSESIQAELQKWRNEYMKDTELSIPETICSELSQLIFAESKITVSGGTKRAEMLQTVVDDFMETLSEKTDLAHALGCMVFKPYVVENDIFIDYVTADCFYPIAFGSDGILRSAVFAETQQVQDAYFTRLEYHEYDGKRKLHTVSNYTFVTHTKGTLGTPIGLEGTPWNGMSPVTEIVAEYPLFGFYRVQSSSKKDFNTPMGVSVYARAVKLIASANRKWDNFMWELDAKGTSVFATEDLLDNQHLTDVQKRLFMKLSRASDEASMEVFSPEIRHESFIKSINTILQRIEYACHLAYGSISLPSETEKTATEVKASEKRSFTFVAALQKRLENAIIHLIYAIDKLISYHQLAPEGTYQVSFCWGDSIQEDTETEFRRRVLLTQSGYLKPELLLGWYFGCDEESAKKMIPAQSNGYVDLFSGGDT